MKLNDPDNANPVRAREVLYTTKVGNVIYEGVFDPGSPDDPVEPNPDSDFDVTYTDGWFDWQNATPAIYVGASNGTSQGATAVQGVFIPGDFNADGTVDATDRAIIDANIDMVDTSYSRGDLNQDGVTNAADLSAWDALGGATVAGDFNGNGMRDVGDLDALAGGMATNDLAFDLNDDGNTDIADRTFWVNDLANTHMGDSNFDGEFSSADFVTVFVPAKYETGQPATWSEGDWDGDGVFSSTDFVVAFVGAGYETGPREGGLQTVPEPSSIALLLVGVLACGLSRRRR
jgi:hypothetical protein